MGKLDIFNMLNSENVAGYVETTTPEVKIGQLLFPFKKVEGIDISNIKGAKNKPIALKLSSFDVAVKPRALNAQLDLEKKEMPFFKESVRIGERDRQNFIKVQPQFRQALAEKVFMNVAALTDGADVQAERMGMQLLQDGKIYISTKDQEISLNYYVPDAHKLSLTGTAKWTDLENSTILEDIMRGQDKIELDTGVRPTRAVCTRSSFNLIKMNKKIKLSEKDNNANYVFSDTEIKQILKNKLDLTVAVIGGTFIAEDGTEQQYFTDDKFTLIPEGALGNMNYGETPEEIDLTADSKFDCKMIKNGKMAITTMKTVDPVSVEIKVSQVCLPSFEQADKIYIMTVK